MGCDIHLFAEVKRNGAWEILPPPLTMTTYRWDYDPECTRDPERPAFYVDGRLAEWYSPRSYWTFGALAGVRSYEADPLDEENLTTLLCSIGEVAEELDCCVVATSSDVRPEFCEWNVVRLERELVEAAS